MEYFPLKADVSKAPYFNQSGKMVDKPARDGSRDSPVAENI